MPAVNARKLDQLRQEVFSLDEESLWELVCKLLPEAAEETLEDIYDALLSASRRAGSKAPADQVFSDEDRRRGISR